MAINMGNSFRRMTVGDRFRAGMGAVGPNHPRVKQMMRSGEMSSMSKPSATADEEEQDDNPDEEGQEPPNFRDADACANCVNFDGESQCQLHHYPTEAGKTCDDFSKGEEPSDDSEQGAEEGGEY